MPKLSDLTIPQLEGGWINLTEAANVLGVTRTYIYKLAERSPADGGLFTLRQVGSQASYVVKLDEILEKKSLRDTRKSEAAEKKEVKSAAKATKEERAEDRELTLEELTATFG